MSRSRASTPPGSAAPAPAHGRVDQPAPRQLRGRTAARAPRPGRARAPGRAATEARRAQAAGRARRGDRARRQPRWPSPASAPPAASAPWPRRARAKVQQQRHGATGSASSRSWPLILGAGYMFWLRDSSLVAINNVDVVGVTSGDREQIVTELTQAAEQQTTLHADSAAIERRRGRSRPSPRSASTPNFPHGMRIEVTERPPALIVSAAGSGSRPPPTARCSPGSRSPTTTTLPVLEVEQAPGAAARLDGDPLARGPGARRGAADRSAP